MVEELEVGDVVLCTVEKIEGTLVFVKIDGNGEGTITISEVAPGRIRNLRDYVVPKKKIVCKIIRIRDNRIDLSLRRVTPKERKEITDKYKQERSYISILKKTLGNKYEEFSKKILEKGRIYDFVEDSKEDKKEIEKILGKENAKKILDIVNVEKQKNIIIKKEIFLNTSHSEGIKLIKKLLDFDENITVKYIAAGKYVLQTESSEAKKADNLLKEAISRIEKDSKKEGINFESR